MESILAGPKVRTSLGKKGNTGKIGRCLCAGGGSDPTRSQKIHGVSIHISSLVDSIVLIRFA